MYTGDRGIKACVKGGRRWEEKSAEMEGQSGERGNEVEENSRIAQSSRCKRRDMHLRDGVVCEHEYEYDHKERTALR